jgi:hypothetical protein
VSDATQHTWNLELETVALMMLRGARPWQVAQALDCSPEEARAAVAGVRALWEQEAQAEASDGPGRSLAQLRRIQVRAWERWDDAKDASCLRLALDSERQIVELRRQRGVNEEEAGGEGHRYAIGMQWLPTAGVAAGLEKLTRRQQQAVLRIVQAQMDGVALTRLLKTPYSCRWCGAVLGQSGQGREARKASLAAHEADCGFRGGGGWPFVCSLSTYYRCWAKDEAFQAALAAAWSEVAAQAVALLKASALAAAGELQRQVRQGEKDHDRRQAATAILDRAGVETAAKATQAQQGLVAYVDVTEGELAAIAEALRREAEGGGEV